MSEVAKSKSSDPERASGPSAAEMGKEPPFLYSSPSKYSVVEPYHEFNPKAFTQASRMPPMTKPKRDGPLVDFNKHPDSYLILPYGNINVKAMSLKTKTRVKYARQLQLAFRVLQLVLAIGLLVCAICIRGTKGTEGWILRIPVRLSFCPWKVSVCL